MKHRFSLIILFAILLALIAGTGAFAESDGLVYTVNEDGVTAAITGYDAATLPAALEIPESIDGYTITSVGNYAFKDCGTITSVVLPGSVTAIGNGAFQNTGLQKLVIEAGETPVTINSYAFGGNKSLKEVTMPDDANANSTYSIFDSCSDIALTITHHSGVISGRYLYNHSSYNDKAVTSIVLEEGITEITDYAFYSMDALVNVSLPSTLTTVGSNAFASCDALESVVLPESVTTLGKSAFASNPVLRSVNLPEGLTAIPDYAFSNCPAFELSTVPASVASIGYNAFYNCSAITEFTIPGTCLSIGDIAFQKTGLQKLVIEAGETPVTINSSAFIGNKSLKEVTMPDDVNVNSTYSIFDSCSDITLTITHHSGVISGRYLYTGTSYNDKAVTSMVLEEGITEITDNAFHNMDALVNVSLPSTLTTVGNSVFYSCDALESVVLPQSVTVLGEYVFASNPVLKSVNIPEGLTAIPDYAFSNCPVFELSTVPASVASIGYNAFYNCSAITEFTIPGTCLSIGDIAFQKTGLQKLVIEAGDTPVTINSSAFIGNKSLKEVTMPDDANANSTYSIFDSCSDIALTITHHSGVISGRYLYTGTSYNDKAVTSIVLEEGITEITDNAFHNMDALVDVSLPSTLTTVGNRVFYSCDALESVVLPQSVTVLGEYVFASNPVLKSVNIPEGLTAIPGNAFSNCPVFELSTVPASVASIGNSAFNNCPAITEFTIPGTCLSIGSSAFQKTGLQKLVIEAGDTPVTIASHAFSDNKSLKEVTMPDDANVTASYSIFTNCSDIALTITHHSGVISGRYLYTGTSYNDKAVTSMVLEEGITEITDNAFHSMEALTDVSLPSTLTTVGSRVFYSCDALESVVLPQSVTVLGEYVFASNPVLKSVNIPEGLTAIPSNAFSNCPVFELSTVPASVASIGNNAFNNCPAITEFTIPGTCLSIGSDAFQKTGLQKLVIEAGDTPVTIASHAFSDNKSLKEVTMPDDANVTASYSVFTNCSDIALTITHHSGVISGRYLYTGTSYNDKSVTSMVLEEGITEITDNAFHSMEALTDVSLPSTLTTVGNRVFYSCDALESVVLPESVTTLGEYVFASNPVLKSVNIPEGLTAIPSNAFSNCPVFELSTVPASVASIGNNAFNNCSAITEFTIPGTCLSIGSSAFQKTGLQKLVIEAGETPITINSSAFISNKSLKEVTMPDDANVNSTYSIFDSCSDIALTITHHSGVISGRYLYTGTSYNDKAVTSMVLEEGITEITDNAFHSMLSLRSVSLPSSLTTIGSGAFRSCKQLAALEIPAGVTTLGEYALSNTSLTRIVLPDILTAIGSYAFNQCTVLTEVVFPANLESIGSNAFGKCTALERVEFPAGLATIGSNAFNGSGLTEIILVTDQASTVIESYAFQNCPNIKKVVLGDNVKINAAYSVFSGCEGVDLTIRCVNGAIPNRFFKTGDYADTTISTITIEEGITSIGSKAFYNLDRLNILNLPASITSIGDSAFAQCDMLLSIMLLAENEVTFGSNAFKDIISPTFYIVPESNMDVYLDELGYGYTYYVTDGASATAVLPEGVDSAEYAGMKLQLTDLNGSALITCVITEGRSEYVYQGLNPGNMYGLRLTDKHGFVLAETAPVTFSEGENTLTFESLPALIDLTANVTAPDGSDLSESVAFIWYSAAGKRLSGSAELKNIPEGTQLTLSCTLSDDAARRYASPESVSVTASEETANLSVVLAAHETVTLTGTVTDADDAAPLSGVRVSALQNYTGSVSAIVSTVTGSDGAFSLDVHNVPGTLVFSAQDYLEQRVSTADYIASPAAIALAPVRGIVIDVNASLRYAAAEGEEPIVSENYQDSGLIEFSLYNLTREAAIRDFHLNNGELVITDGASGGDDVRITAASASGVFPPVIANVKVSDTETVACDITLTGYGRVRLTRKTSENQNDAAYLYDAEGKLVREMTVRYGEATAANLPEGEYTLLVMGADNTFAGVNSLQAFNALSLTEGADYLREAVSVQNGAVTLCAVDHIPASAKGAVSYVDREATVFSSNKTSTALGLYFALKAQTALEDKFAGATDMAWEFTLPDNLSYYPNSLSVNGALSAHSIDGNTLSVRVSDPSDLVRLCVLSVESGKNPVSAVFTFTCNGKTYRQPIGNLPLEVTDMVISIPEKTSNSSVVIHGTTVINSTVEIYDNGKLLATTRSKSDGTWITTVELPYPGSYSGHLFRVKVITSDGKTLTSQPHCLWYSHSELEVSKVYMDMSGRFLDPGDMIATGNRMAFDFARPSFKVNRYSYSTSRAIFTFSVEFTGGNPADASNVKVHVTTDRDDSRVLDAIYYEETGMWVASDKFTVGLPINVGVSFDSEYKNALVYSPEDAQALRDEGLSYVEGLDVGFTDELLVNTYDGSEGEYIEAISILNSEGEREYLYLHYTMEPVTDAEIEAAEVTADGLEAGDYTTIGLTADTPAYYMRLDDGVDYMTTVAIDPIRKTRHVMKLTTTDPRSPVARTGKPILQVMSAAGKAVTLGGVIGGIGADAYADQRIREIEDMLNNAAAAGVSQCTIDRIRKNLDRVKKELQRARNLSNAMTLFGLLPGCTYPGAIGDGGAWLARSGGQAKLDAIKGVLGFHMQCPENIANDNCIPIGMKNIPTMRGNCDYDPDMPPPRNPNASPARDPSGYVYEAVASNRISGVTASAYQRVTKYDMYDEPYVVDELWNAEEYSQLNPMNTDENGAYGWDVPVGLWQVRWEKEGYEDAESPWMEVPPIRTEVNVGLVSYVQPEVKYASVDFDAVDIAFTKYMDITTVTSDTLIVTANGEAVAGTIEFPDMEVSPDKAGVYYASKVRFVPDAPFAEGSEVTVVTSRNVRSYAGVAMAKDHTLTAAPEAQPRTLYATETLELTEGQKGVISVTVLPKGSAAGRKVSVATSIGVIEVDVTELVLDENGCGEINVAALMTGSAPVLVALEGTDLYMECSVNVAQRPNPGKVATPTASIPAGCYVVEGSTMELFCDTEGASIYYTMDDTCPCNSVTRILYTGPITLTDGATLRACAEKEGMEQSEVLKVPFIVTVEEGILTLPASLTSIEDEAFVQCAHIQQVIVPEGVTYIGVRAFKDCVSLKKIVIPDSVSRIRNCAFVNCPQVVIWCNADSYAHEFAITHDLAYHLMD